MHFTMVSDITAVETIAINQGILEVARLRKQYAIGRWRKRKGIATVLLADGTAHTAEVHYHE
jgi:hypothetical protein